MSATVQRGIGRTAPVRAAFTGPGAFEAYRRLYATGADVERIGEDFSASVETQVTRSLVVSRRTLRGVAHSRDAERVGRDAFDHLTLGFVRAGELELQTGRGQTMRAGDVFFLDMTKPVRYRAQVEMTTVSLPRALLPQGMDASGLLHGLCLRGRAAAPLSRWLESSRFGVHPQETLADALAAVLKPANDPDGPAPPRARHDRVREMIEAALSDLDPTSERLARQLGMSRATLYRAFEPLGSIQRWRQRRRLLRLKALVAFTDASIREAAQAVGLESAAHASTLFSRAFGVSPSQFRRSADRVGGQGEDAHDLRFVFDNIPAIMLRGHADAFNLRG